MHPHAMLLEGTPATTAVLCLPPQAAVHSHHKLVIHIAAPDDAVCQIDARSLDVVEG